MRANRYVFGAGLAAAVLGCPFGVLEPNGPLDEEAIGYFSTQLDATDDVALSLEGINGAVTIVGGASATVDIQAERRVRSGSRSDAESFLALVTVEVSQLGGRIEVRTEEPNHTDRREVVVNYELTVPSYLTVDVSNVNGSIDIRSVEASVTVQNVNGVVYVRDVVGDVVASVVNGNIEADVALVPGGTVDLGVVNGNIGLDVPVSVSAMLDADVANGTISISGLTLTQATTSPRSLHGRLGAGDGLVELDVTNGIITVRGR